jgi:TRAP transporter TAXI family solute receptor
MRRAGFGIGFGGLLGVTLVLLVSALDAQERPRILRWVTFPAGSLNHVMTSGMASVVDAHMKISSRVASFTGYRDYVPLIDKGEADLGILNALDAWGAYHGKTPFYQAKHRNLRLIRSAPAGKVAVLVPAVSRFKSVADLKGARVVGGYDAHMVCRYLAEAMLATGGLGWKDLTVLPVASVLPGIQALMDGRVEAAPCAAPGMPIIREADARIGIRWLPVNTGPEAVKRMKEIFPGSFVDTLKAGEVPGLKEDIPVLGYHFYLTSSTHADENTVYQITRTMWDHNEELFKINPQLKYWTDEHAVVASMAIPYHPGAIRFYKEKGAWTPEMERVQQDLLLAK